MRKAVSWNDIERELQSFTFPDKDNETIIFGAGFSGVVAAPMLLKENLQIVAFCDNDEQKWGTEILGLTCIAPHKLKEYKKPFVLVASIKFYADIAEQLSAMGVSCCTVDAYVVQQHLSSFYETYCMLDEDSQSIYSAVLSCRIRGNMTQIRAICTDNQYFALPEFRFCELNEVFVDCGAFTGDVIQRFIDNVSGHFSKIYAFEPHPASLAALNQRMDYQRSIWLFNSEQIVSRQVVLAQKGGAKVPVYLDQADMMNTSTYTAHSSSRVEEWVETISLDQYFEHEYITFLKADIEGSEWDMLLGGEKTIRNSRPKMALCIYHNIYDFFRIPLLVKKWVPEYHFAVRHHWSSFNETVLYCYT